MIAFLTTVSTLFVGLMVGIVGGYFRGRVDDSLGRLTDFLLAFPSFFMIVALTMPMVDRIKRMGVTEDNSARIIFLIMFLTFFGWPGFSRLIRSQVLSLREKDFVTAAQAMGASRIRIIFKELLPNLLPTVLVLATLAIPTNILAEAGLSFLGVGVLPPTPTWGGMINDALSCLNLDPFYMFVPGMAIFIVVLAFNLFGDGLRDATDTRASDL